MQKPQALFKIATRFYPPIAFEMGYLAQVKRMPELFGFGMSNIVIRFDGKKMDVFRVLDDMEAMRERAIRFVSEERFFAEIQGFENEVETFIKRASESNTPPLEIVEMMSGLYPYSVLSFFLTGAWENDLPKERKESIVAMCLRYREPADRMMSAYLSYFEKFFKEEKLSSLMPLAVALGEDPEKYQWMEEGFIFSDNQFLHETWETFCAGRGYSYEEEKFLRSGEDLRGVCAHSGRVQGIVRVVWSPRDISAFQEGEVLVTSMTTPLFLPAMKKAAAIITDEGGVTCHAAILARELHKPCVIGVKIATKILKDGDEVEVDAALGIVRVLL